MVPLSGGGGGGLSVGWEEGSLTVEPQETHIQIGRGEVGEGDVADVVVGRE